MKVGRFNIPEFETLPKWKKLVVGISSTVFGSAISIGSAMSLGTSLDVAVKELTITAFMSLLAVVAYGIGMRIKRDRDATKKQATK
jgi:hypothetical protein